MKAYIAARISVEDRGHSTPCWLWNLCVTPKGYARATFNLGDDQKNVRVHRASYEAHRGPIGDGLELDHICRVRRCVNPDHLQPVTRDENLRREWAWRKQELPADCERIRGGEGGAIAADRLPKDVIARRHGGVL